MHTCFNHSGCLLTLRLFRFCCDLTLYKCVVFLLACAVPTSVHSEGSVSVISVLCCVVCNCVLTGYAAEPLNVIGHIRQTLHEWGLLSPPSDITALSHLFSPHVEGLNSARRRLQVRGVFTTAALHRAAAVVRRGRTRPDNCACHYLAKQDLRTESVIFYITANPD